MNTLSVELLERSDPNFYAELTQQLQNAYLTTIDTAVVAASKVALEADLPTVRRPSAVVYSTPSNTSPNLNTK